MKIEPAMFFHTKYHIIQGGDQNDDLITKENCNSLSVLLKVQIHVDDKWLECKELKNIRKFNKMSLFFW